MISRLGIYAIAIITITFTLVLSGCLSGSGDGSSAVDNPGTGGGNNAPVISGTPPGAVVTGENYLFTPTASDSDGDTLTFSVQNKPDWLDFNTTSGALSGAATVGNVGTYASIRISVSDGSLSASLPQFSVSVTQSANGSVILSWTAPTQNSDGSALQDLAGYKVYYGTSAGSYSNQVRIDNPGITTHVIENLSPNTYFFSATAFNAAGVESDLSNEASKQIM